MSRDDAPNFMKEDKRKRCWFCMYYNGGLKSGDEIRACLRYDFEFSSNEYSCDHCCESFEEIK
jgi:hypothetical protein